MPLRCLDQGLAGTRLSCMLAIEIILLPFFQQISTHSCKQLPDHIPICLKPTPKESALVMISPPPLRFRSHLFPWTCCSCPRHLCTLPAPADVSGASGPPARALGGQQRLARLTWASRALWRQSDELELPGPLRGVERKVFPARVLLFKAPSRERPEGDALHCLVTAILRTSIFCSTPFGIPRCWSSGSSCSPLLVPA